MTSPVLSNHWCLAKAQNYAFANPSSCQVPYRTISVGLRRTGLARSLTEITAQKVSQAVGKLTLALVVPSSLGAPPSIYCLRVSQVKSFSTSNPSPQTI